VSNISLGVDGATHMAEEIENASTVIPRALIVTVLVNGVTGWAMLVVVFFCMGNIDDILETGSSFSFVTMFYAITQSVPGASILVSLYLII
jgi:choline transport protein